MPDLEERERCFIAAHNAEIRRARLAGEIAIDLRRCLTTHEAIEGAFRADPTRVLARKQPLVLAGGEVLYEVFIPRPPKTPPRFRPPQEPSVRRVDEHGRRWVMAYDGTPIPVVVAADGETLALGAGEAWIVIHVRTGADLQTFRRAGVRG